MTFNKKLLGLAIGLSLGLGLTAGADAATTFKLGSPGVSLDLGSGWGFSNGGEGVLGANFDLTNVNNRQWSMNVGGTETFKVGEIELVDSCIEGSGNACSGESGNETNNLQVTYTFNVILPGNVEVDVSAVGVAVTGDVDDSGTDLTLAFGEIVQNFGNGGQYRIDIQTVTFTGTQTRNVNAQFTLVSESTSSSVPEPMTLSLLGAGLIGLGAVARRRRS